MKRDTIDPPAGRRPLEIGAPLNEDEDRNFCTAEMLEIIDGATPQEAKARVAERMRVSREAEKLLDLPIEGWPQFEMRWTTAPDCFHHSLDGAKPSQVKRDELLVLWATVDKIDAVLHPYNLRSAGEVWSVGDKRKAAGVIVHCSEGRELSPIWLNAPNGGKIGLRGGNHRLAVARAKGIKIVPLLLYRKDETAVRAILPILDDQETDYRH